MSKVLEGLRTIVEPVVETFRAASHGADLYYRQERILGDRTFIREPDHAFYGRLARRGGVAPAEYEEKVYSPAAASTASVSLRKAA